MYTCHNIFICMSSAHLVFQTLDQLCATYTILSHLSLFRTLLQIFSMWCHDHSKCKEVPTYYLLADRGKAQTGFPSPYLFPGFFFLLFSYFCSFMVVWGFRVGVLDFVLVLGFQLKRFGACGMGPSGLFGLGVSI